MIRIDTVWLATQPLDMRSGFDSCLARVITVFGAAHPHTAYLFTNQRANRMKELVHDGIGFGWPPGGCTKDTLSGQTRSLKRKYL